MDLEFHQLDLHYEGLRIRDPSRERQLLWSLDEHGQQVPIVVASVGGEPERFRVMDGYKRLRALKRLHQDTVKAVVLPTSEEEALLVCHSLRSSRESTLEEAWLLLELQRSQGWKGEELALRLGRSRSWVSRRLGLVEALPSSVQAYVRDGLLPVQGAMKALVPLAKASREDCERLARAIVDQRLKLTTRQLERLWAGWRDGSAAVRERLLKDPGLFLRSQRELEQRQSAGRCAAEVLVSGLRWLLGQVRRRYRQWHELRSVLAPDQYEQVRRTIEQLRQELGRWTEELTEQGEESVLAASAGSDAMLEDKKEIKRVDGVTTDRDSGTATRTGRPRRPRRLGSPPSRWCGGSPRRRGARPRPWRSRRPTRWRRSPTGARCLRRARGPARPGRRPCRRSSPGSSTPSAKCPAPERGAREDGAAPERGPRSTWRVKTGQPESDGVESAPPGKGGAGTLWGPAAATATGTFSEHGRWVGRRRQTEEGTPSTAVSRYQEERDHEDL